MSQRIHRTSTAVAAAIGLLLSIPALAQSAEPTTQIDLPAQPLAQAIQAVARQASVNILVDPRLVAGFQAPAVKAQMSVNQALNFLLRGTGLTPRFVDDKTITLVAANTAVTSIANVSQAEMMRLAQAETSSAESGSAASAPGSEQKPNAAGPEENSGAKLEEIVVTAQKREERLQNVPISISVLRGDDLDRSTVEGIAEALNRVPGVATVEGNQGAGTNVMVRGVSAQGPLFVGSNAIAYYLDSVPFGLVKTAFSPDSNAYDMERVEVLRGPQGTLYGASALNGVVRVLTKDANLNEVEFKARASASGTEDGGENYRGDAALNVPIVAGKLAARAVVGYQNLSGWIDRPNEKDANDAQLRNWRLKLNAQPTEKLAVGLSAWSSRSDYDGAPAGDGDNKRNSLLNEPLAIDYDAYGLKMGYDFTGVSVTSMTSYLDYTNGGVLDILSLVGVSLPFFTGFDSDVFSQEVNIQSTHGGSWRWSAGGIYRDGSSRLRQGVLPTISGDQDETSESFALFAEATRLFLEGQWELTAGLRYFHDKVGLIERQSAGSTLPLFQASDSFNATTPRIVLTWHRDTQSTIYASYGEGFRSGVLQDINAARLGFPSIKPDNLKNYEVGAKGNRLGGRLNFDTAIYYIDWQDVQQQTSAPNPIFADLQTTVLINGTSASGAGVDFGVTIEPVEGLTLGLNASWNDLQMDAEVFSAGIVLFAKGDRPTFSPETTVGASADYVFPLGSNGLKGRFSASANHTSRMDFRTIIGTQQIAHSDPLLIARTSFSIDSPDRWGATLFVDNINNEQGSPFRSPFALGIADWDSRVRPRTIGVQLEYRF